MNPRRAASLPARPTRSHRRPATSDSLAPMGLTEDGEGVRLGQRGTEDTVRQAGLPESIKAAGSVSVTFDVASVVSAPRVP